MGNEASLFYLLVPERVGNARGVFAGPTVQSKLKPRPQPLR